MKKVRLSGKELQRIGFPNEVSKSLTKAILSKHYKSLSKTEILELLTGIIQNPDKYKNHAFFSKLIVALNPTPNNPKREIKINPSPIPYKVFGKKEIDPGALKQMDHAMQLPITKKGALMADAHQGYGLPIGGVLATENAVIPYGVGMDIGCRMCLSVYHIPVDRIEKDRAKLKQILLNETRFGNDEFVNPCDHPVIASKAFNEVPLLKTLKQKAYKQLGTSGHGNHFVDIGAFEVTDSENIWNLSTGTYFAILSHSGSRGMGAEIARHYTRIAKDYCQLPKGYRELSWLDLGTEEGQEYWLAMNLAGEYSAANHEQIHKKLSIALAEEPIFKLENHHNFAWKEKLDNGREYIIHRKGAIPASKCALGIIPGSMATPAFIVQGLGNIASLNSAAHGAGRLLSRKLAKQSVSKKEMEQALQKANIILIGGNTDEAPWVYKDIIKIMEYQKDLVKTIAMFYPGIVRMAK